MRRFVKVCEPLDHRSNTASAKSAPQSAPMRNAGAFCFAARQSRTLRLSLDERFCEIILFASASMSSGFCFGEARSRLRRKKTHSNALLLSPFSIIISRCVPRIILKSPLFSDVTLLLTV